MAKYIVLFVEGIFELEAEVKKKLEQGWICQGGVCIKGEYYLQAMVWEKQGRK
jgi:hypothetical protein